MATEPFLFKFKKECVSPSRKQDLDEYFYDDNLSMVMTIENEKTIPAIETNKERAPMTKKADMEKGDDQKDRWMWK